MSFGLDFNEITGYNAFLAEGWHEWFRRNPGALDVPCDIMDTGSVRQLVKHIFAVELRYAEQLNGRKPPEYEELPDGSLDDLYNIRQRAVESIGEFLKSTSDSALDEAFEVKTRSGGTLSTSRRTIFIHAMMHGTRHWAQLATLTRQAGYPSVGWQDYLFYKLGK
jgi:uncharacterized damage-inducible protein DinB